jgi:hypothetical protein
MKKNSSFGNLKTQKKWENEGKTKNIFRKKKNENLLILKNIEKKKKK